MNKSIQLLSSLFAATLVLSACGGGGSASPAPAPAPVTPTQTKDVTVAFAAGQEWKTSVANQTVTVQVNLPGGGGANGAVVSLYSIAKVDPIDGSALSQDMWIRKGLLVKGATNASGTFTVTDLLLPDAASSQVIAVAELSTTSGTAPNVTVTGVSNASGVATVGGTTTLTLVDRLNP